ncbi:MAG TPA: hypothetical protein VM389_12280 [Phycisphaerae bacterium]|nr:hypothetical protein [Phycisphaerae bacterium]
MAQGVTIYAAGDTVAALILSQFSLGRLVGMMAVGATFYAFEIPNWFAWIDRKVTSTHPVRMAAARTGLAMLYFNPLWIARHLLFVALAAGDFAAVSPDLLRIGAISWLANVPLSVAGNFVIQVKLPLEHRFAGSAIFSGLMATYYSLSAVLFGG